MKTCIIFAGGEFSAPSFTDTKADLVICADRGYIHAEKLGIVPDIITGDFDSYIGELPEDTEIYRSVPEKDDTDTMLAVKLAIDRKCTDIRLYGALGGRFDHTFANIQALIYAHEHGCKMTVYDIDNIITVQGIGTELYEKYDGWYFSVFSLTEKLHVEKMTGVKYPVQNHIFTQGFPLGVSNEIISDNAVVSVKNGLALIVRSRR
ncbi:MAG: thiamine diphosphokinase [Ruminococcus sp.]|nr:thiamine diphosphokinase [Ruminococcus sp.]